MGRAGWEKCWRTDVGRNRKTSARNSQNIHLNSETNAVANFSSDRRVACAAQPAARYYLVRNAFSQLTSDKQIGCIGTPHLSTQYPAKNLQSLASILPFQRFTIISYK